MKIAYFSTHPLNRNDGVVKKINTQILSWQRDGCEVICFSEAKDNRLSIVKVSKIYKVYSYFLALFSVNKKMIHDIDDFNPDIVYVRYGLWNKNYAYLAKN